MSKVEKLFANLKRSKTDKFFAGVCGGFGRWSGVPSWILRILWFVSIWFYGIGLIAYILFFIFMPKEES